MKRFKPSNSLVMKERLDGKYVLFQEAAEAVELVIQSMEPVLKWVIAHEDDIENDINDFGELKPVLDILKRKVN